MIPNADVCRVSAEAVSAKLHGQAVIVATTVGAMPDIDVVWAGEACTVLDLVTVAHSLLTAAQRALHDPKAQGPNTPKQAEALGRAIAALGLDDVVCKDLRFQPRPH